MSSQASIIMMSESDEISIEDAPATFKSFLWQHFGFLVAIINGKSEVDKTRTIRKHYKIIKPYTAANTSTMQKHLQAHHGTLLKAIPPVKLVKDRQLTSVLGFHNQVLVLW